MVKKNQKHKTEMKEIENLMMQVMRGLRAMPPSQVAMMIQQVMDNARNSVKLTDRVLHTAAMLGIRGAMNNFKMGLDDDPRREMKNLILDMEANHGEQGHGEEVTKAEVHEEEEVEGEAEPHSGS